MPQTLLLRLPADGEEETEWLMLDESGAPLLSRQRGSLTLAAAVARSAKVVVLAPASQILLAEPELPPGSGAKLARAVPFALEEQLTEDVDQLSFAVGRRRITGTPVAVVSRSVMQGWLNVLQSAGLEAQAIYPDISLMPENPGQTVLWFEGSRLAVLRPGAMPFAVELSPVKEALVVAGVIADPLDTSAESRVSESALLYITREDWARTQGEFEALVEEFASLKVQLLSDGPLPWLSRSIDSPDVINLLQGEFSRGTDYGARWRKWRTAAGLAAALLLVHVAAQALQLQHAKRDAASLDTQIADLYNSAMPSSPAVPIHDARRDAEPARSHPQERRRAAVFSARVAGLERRGGGNAQDQHRFLELSRTIDGHEGECPQSGRDLAAVAIRRQARPHGRHSILDTRRERRRSTFANTRRAQGSEMNKLRAWYEGLQPREQRMVAFGGIALALIVLFGGILLPLQSAVSGVESSNETKRQDLVWMRAHAAEIRAAGNQLPVDNGEPPVVVVDRVGRAAGLTDALRGTQPNGNGVRVQLEGAPFDTVVTWLATLDQRYGLSIESITVDRTVKPGLINASITFTQART